MLAEPSQLLPIMPLPSRRAIQAAPKPSAIKSTVTFTLTTPSPTRTTRILLRASATKCGKKVSFQASLSQRVDAVERWIEDAKAAGKGQGPWTEADRSDEEPLWARITFGGKEGEKGKRLAWGDVHPKKLFAEEAFD